MIATITAAIIIGISLLIAFKAGSNRNKKSISEYLVGGRSFPAWLVFFLAVGEVYSLGTLLAFPGGIYAKGSSYGVWFVGYILLAYTFGYFIAPLLWRAGKKYNGMTNADLVGFHFNSKIVEVVIGVTLLLGLVPWGQFQFIGIQVALTSLGLNLTPLTAVIIAACLAFAYVSVSGVRSPAMVSLLKDTLMIVAAAAVAIAVVMFTGGKAGATAALTTPAAPLSASMITINGSQMVYALSTILIQSVVFYSCLQAGQLTAKSEATMKKSIIWMPLYMLVYPILTFVAFYALKHFPDIKPNDVFMSLARDLLPPWVFGIVVAAVLLAGLLVLSVSALAISALVTRNLLPKSLPSSTQRRWSVFFVAAFLISAALLNLYASNLMLVILTLFYALSAQALPGMLAMMFGRRIAPMSIAVGAVVGVIVAVGSYIYIGGTTLDGGLNSCVLSLGANALIIAVWRLLAPADYRQPIVMHVPSRG